MWYSISTKCSDKAKGFQKLDMFFKAVMTLMSKQIWDIIDCVICKVYLFMDQFSSGNSELNLFAVKLQAYGAQIRFSPPLSNIDGKLKLILATFQLIIKEIVAAVSEIPRIESKLFTSFSQQPLFISAINLNDHRISELNNLRRSVIAKSIIVPQKHLQIFEKYQSLLNGKADKKISDFLAEQPNLSSYTAEIEKLKELARDISKHQSTIRISLINLDCDGLKIELISRTNMLIAKILDQVGDINRKANIVICDNYEIISAKVLKFPSDTEELVAMTNYIEIAKVQDLSLREEISKGKHRLTFLLSYAFMSDEEIKLNSMAFSWPSRIYPLFDLCKKRMVQTTTKIQEDLRLLVDTISLDLDVCFDLAGKCADFTIISEIDTYTQKLLDLEGRLDRHEVSILKINSEELILDCEKSVFPKLSSARQIMDPYKQLWNAASLFKFEYEAWMLGPFINLNPEKIDESVANITKIIFKLIKTFNDQPACKKVAENVKSRLEKFKTYMPLISVLRNPGLRDRHFKMMGDIACQPLLMDDNISLNKLLDMNLSGVLQQFEEISMNASKEHSLSKTLLKMKEHWDLHEFTLVLYKETGTKILSQIEDLQAILDDQIVKVQTMLSSPFLGVLGQEVKEWEITLLSIQDILDAWLTVQSTWLYLEPIFSSDDITAAMPNESKKFRAVDKTWRDISSSASNNPRVLMVILFPNILSRLKEGQALLEEIQKGLNDYLEKKRLYFPRFFFLSNDELLEILAETKDPMRVQPHIKKCFEGISTLVFQDKTKIISMCSSENEIVKFKEHVEPALAKGAVEKWLLQIEKVMQASIHQQVSASLEVYPEVLRENWVLDWPGQVVLCVSQLDWTKEVTNILRSGNGARGLKQYAETCTRQLEKTVALVRGDLTSMARQTLSALVVIDVHARDVVLNMASSGVSDENDFEWLSQLRYYWEECSVAVRMVNSTLPYGFEYLGNSPRLVITPLTDRCYRTLIGAIDLNLGGAPEGPAGS